MRGRIAAVAAAAGMLWWAAAGQCADVAPLEKQQGSHLASMLAGYQIHPDDVLQVTVYEEPDLSTKVRVTSKGEVGIPLLGTIQAGGLSITELEQKITALLRKDYLVNPQVTIFLESAQQIFVTGAINKPGAYPFSNEHEMTAMEAIAMAGGFAPAASMNQTRIIRKADGREQTIPVKAKAIVKGDKHLDIPLKPGDIIYIPESFF